jgi:hypothetical protein
MILYDASLNTVWIKEEEFLLHLNIFLKALYFTPSACSCIDFKLIHEPVNKWTEIVTDPNYGRNIVCRNMKSVTRIKALPKLRCLVAGFPLRGPAFDSTLGYVGFMVDKVTLQEVSSNYFGVSC